MRFLALALILALAPASYAGPRRGRVVRVERPRTGGRGTPRICQFSTSDLSGSCFGLPPTVDETAPVVTDKGIVGTVRITSVELQNPGGGTAPSACVSGLWKASLELTSGDPTAIPSYGGWVILDVALTPSGKLAEAPTQLPSGTQGEQAAVAVDREGDGEADFLVTWYPCPGSNPGAQTYCVDYWNGGGARWSKLRSDSVTWCM